MILGPIFVSKLLEMFKKFTKYESCHDFRSVSEIRSNTSSPVYLGPALNKDRYQRSAAKDKFLPLSSEDQVIFIDVNVIKN